MTEMALACPVCAHVTAMGNAPEVVTDTGYDLVRCWACATLFTDARTAPPASELYPAFDQSVATGSATAARRAVRGFLAQRVAIARQAMAVGRLGGRDGGAGGDGLSSSGTGRHRSGGGGDGAGDVNHEPTTGAVGSGGRSLDFGAGNGAFARAMASAGFDSVGLEPFSLGNPQASAGLLLLRAPLEDAAATLGTFDVITLWHVLEHLEDPVATLQTLAGLLTPDGAVVVCVPNEGSWQRRLFRRSWFHLDPPRHLIHFDTRTLTKTLQQAGLRIAGSVPFVPEYGTSGWVQSTLNLVLPHRNFLYEVVKDRGALRTMKRPTFVGHLAASVVLGGPLLLLSYPVEWLAARRDKAATVTLIARRAE